MIFGLTRREKFALAALALLFALALLWVAPR
jgi:hypothetical protein